MLGEIDLKEQLRTKEKKLMETEYSLESVKSKLEHDLELTKRQKDQLIQDKRVLEEKIEILQREMQKHNDNERDLRKEISKLTYSNEELAEEAQRWKKKYNESNREFYHGKKKIEDSYDSHNEQRLIEIERKLETIIKYQKTNSGLLKGKLEQPSAEVDQVSQDGQDGQDDDDDENLEGMLKDLTSQILEKDELRNENVIKTFKLDQIQLDDKEHEYKNLLRAMAALYFANRYNKMVPTLFSYWRCKFQEKINYYKKDVEELKEEDNEEDLKQSDEGADDDLQKFQHSEREYNKLQVDTELANKEAIGRDPTDKRGAKNLQQEEGWEDQFDSNDNNDDFLEKGHMNRKAISDQDLGERYQNFENDEDMEDDLDEY